MISRILVIAQGQIEALPILTADRSFGRYEIETIWSLAGGRRPSGSLPETSS